MGTPRPLPVAAPARPALVRPRSRLSKPAAILVGSVVAYLAFAYLLAPAAWKRYARRHPALEDVPGVTHTGSGIPGDPLNVALIGTKEEVIRAMLAAKWHPADPLTLRSCLGIAASTVFRRSYADAPVSSLYLWGRKQDLAFEQDVGRDARERHHVRFWRAPKDDPDGRPVWVGADIFDEKVGFSRTTGQITHVTDPDIDTERDLLYRELERTGDLAEFYVVRGFHKICKGRNGGGDPWHTDGNLYVGVLTP